MASADVEKPQEPASSVPDYLASPNAILADQDVEWRYGHAPDYSKTRAEWEKTKSMTHEAGSLPQLVENLVKNWEVEASFKPRLQDWRTIDHSNYSFAINGGTPQTAEHMLKVGTYNAIVAANEFYSPEFSDFAASHKTFKRMMPTFAWEVLEVYSGPPRVAFRWRHWGEMKSDYVGFNDKGEKITVKAHGGAIDIQGVTVAEVDDKVRLRKVETWFDPMEMFRQIAPKGVVNKQIVNEKVSQPEIPEVPSNDGVKIAEDHNSNAATHHDPAPEDVVEKEISPSTNLPADAYVPHKGASGAAEIGPDATVKTESASDDGATSESSDKTWEKIEHESLADTTTTTQAPAEDAAQSDKTTDTTVSTPDDVAKPSNTMQVTTQTPVDTIEPGTGSHAAGQTSDVEHSKTMEIEVKPTAGEAVVAAPDSEETKMTHEEMSKISPMECPFLMNRE